MPITSLRNAMSIESIKPHTPTYAFPAHRPEYRSDQSRASFADLKDPQKSEGEKDQAGPNELTPSEKDLVKRLEQRDAEVRRHEQAHLSGAGAYAKGSARFDYQRGPDGKNYAVGGEVSLDVSKVPNDPQATIQKMEVIRKSALAPAEPSSKDQSIARNANNAIQQARMEMSLESRDENSDSPLNPYARKNTSNIAEPTFSLMA